MTVVFVLVVIAVLGAAAMLAVGRLGDLPPAEPDVRPDPGDGQVAFDVVLRGYRMDEVDERLAAMQRQIDDLQGRDEADGLPR